MLTESANQILSKAMIDPKSVISFNNKQEKECKFCQRTLGSLANLKCCDSKLCIDCLESIVYANKTCYFCEKNIDDYEYEWI